MGVNLKRCPGCGKNRSILPSSCPSLLRNEKISNHVLSSGLNLLGTKDNSDASSGALQKNFSFRAVCGLERTNLHLLFKSPTSTSKIILKQILVKLSPSIQTPLVVRGKCPILGQIQMYTLFLSVLFFILLSLEIKREFKLSAE